MTDYTKEFFINLEALGMKESDLGKKFKHTVEGHWCEFIGVIARNPKKPMVFKMRNKIFKTSIKNLKFQLGYR